MGCTDERNRERSRSVKIKTVIFDFDGVIVESNQIKESAFVEIFKDHPAEHEAMQKFRRENPVKDRYAIFEFTAKEVFKSQEPKELQDKWAKAYQTLTRNGISDCSFVSGALELLNEFNKKIPLYVSSLTPEPELKWLVEKRGLAPYFKNVFGKPRNKPETILHILEIEKISKNDAVFVGDSTEDLKAAEKAGVPFVGRRGSSNFEGCRYPVYDDLFGVADYIRENL